MSQPSLPGLEHLQAPVQPAQFDFHDDGAARYSGPIPGQRVMGVKNLGGDAVGHPSRRGNDDPFYTVDHTGFVQDAERVSGKWVAPAEIAAKTTHKSAGYLYASHGGGLDDVAHVQEHWKSQPLHQVRADAPIHTWQDPEETLHDPEWKNGPSGRDRVNAIRASVQNGQPIRKAAWLVKHSGRLYALDGHHRVLAAREEGMTHFPARVWDWDKENGR